MSGRPSNGGVPEGGHLLILLWLKGLRFRGPPLTPLFLIRSILWKGTKEVELIAQPWANLAALSGNEWAEGWQN
jgi:hypothetical protein